MTGTRSLVLTAGAVVLTALSAFAADYPLTVKDDGGNPVTLARKPERVISLTLFTDDVLVEILEPRRLLGVTAFATDPAISNVPGQAAAVPHKLRLNAEVILSLQPDLLFVANWTEADKVELLRRAGVPVFLTASGLTLVAIQEKILTVARLVGETEKGRALVDSMNARLAAVEKRLAALPAGRRLSVMDYTTFGAAMGKGSSWDQIVRLAGLRNAVGELAVDEWGQVPLAKEKLLELDPDILVLPGWVFEDTRSGADAFFRQVTGDPALQGLRAVRSRRVVRMPENLKSTTSQYIVAAVEYLARLAYPELFR